LSLGGVNASIYTGDATYVPVVGDSFWEVTSDAIRGSQIFVAGNISVIIDSGSAVIVGPADDVAKFYVIEDGTAAPQLGEGLYTVECDKTPVMSLSFGGRPFYVSTETFSLGYVPGTNNTRCVGGIVASDVTKDFWIVGDVFMQNVYSVFDYGNRSVGFALLS